MKKLIVDQKRLGDEAGAASPKAGIGRSCGACSLCCKLLGVEKPPGTWSWCEHCRPGNGGCTIYDQRPDSCRDYTCDWLAQSALGDEWQPTRSKMVLTTVPDGKTGRFVRVVRVDPDWPDVWRREPYHAQLRIWALHGLRDQDRIIYTRVEVGPGRQLFVILPDADVEITAPQFAIVPAGPDRWKIVQFESEEQVQHWKMMRALDLEKTTK